MKFHNCIVLVLFLCVINFASVLGDLAAALPERTFVKVPANTTLQGLSMPYSLFYYNDSGCWDPINKRMQWIGSGGTCCTNGQYYLMTYKEADNTWTIQNAPMVASGHGFEGNTMDPKTGDHYFSLFRSRAVRKLSSGKWSTLPDVPYSVSASNALAWFPEINNGKGALVHFGPNGNAGWFDGTKWTMLAKPAQPWGSPAMFAQYNPVEKFVWVGGGDGARRIHYKLDSHLNLTRFSDAPFDMRVNESLSSVDPVSGKHIITNGLRSTLAFWEFDPDADRWTRLTNLPGMPTDRLGLQIPIPEHGVIMYLRHQNAHRDVYLYRHSKGSSVQVARADLSTSPRISVAPNPFNSLTRIAVSHQSRPGGTVSNFSLKIFDINGKMVKNLSSIYLPSGRRGIPCTFYLQAAGLSAGVYIVKATAGKEQITKKIYLMK